MYDGSFIKRQTNDTPSGNEWQREVQRAIKPTTKHPKKNSLNLEEDLEEGLLN